MVPRFSRTVRRRLTARRRQRYAILAIAAYVGLLSVAALSSRGRALEAPMPEPRPGTELLAPSWIVAEAVECVVLRAVDGDTLDLSCPAGTVRVRLEGVDAPEMHGACPAERTLAELVHRSVSLLVARPVLFWPAYKDRWGRTVGHIEVDGADLGAALVAAGLAAEWPHDPAGEALAPRPAWCLDAPMPAPRPARR